MEIVETYLKRSELSVLSAMILDSLLDSERNETDSWVVTVEL